MRNRLSRALPVAVALLAAVAVLPVSAATAAVPEPAAHTAQTALAALAALADEDETYIVTLQKDLDPVAVADMVGATPVHVFDTALHGFSARLSPAQVTALRAMPGVESIEEDGETAGFGTF
ncbi:protease inhibitor I9 family protein [Streptomyces sp. NBC_01310]|uniref:protease inhibitor I9 family protein n=1 Tax=Streptomyces sp. NBC_01310 TaxID=2903820 RepID=UPI0035B5A294|nr:protease inhibitor I9 family protein [Streptomyces sp. NBC_01310]